MSEHRTIAGREVAVKNLEKLFFPKDSLTKGDVIDYYARMGERILKYVGKRALTIRRFPDGIEQEGFFQKSAGDYFPDWIETAIMDKREGTIEQVVANEAAVLVYLADLGMIELHAPLSRIDNPDKPDSMIFDLDPPDDYTDAVRHVALALRKKLEDLDLPSFVKTTGSRGFHIVVPLERRHDFGSVRDFSRRMADCLAERMSDTVTTEQRKDKRRGRIFIDTQRNAYGQTAVAPYSLRARAEAPVACPLHWHEVERTDVHPRMVTLTSIARRLSQTNDPWADFEERSVSLGSAIRRL